MKWSFVRKWNAVALGLALLLMGIDSAISYRNAIKLTESAKHVKHTHEVLTAFSDIFAILTDAESGERGYILFGDKSELKRYYSAIQSLKPKLNRLQTLIATDSSQQRKLVTLKSLLEQRLSLFKQTIDLYQSGHLAKVIQAPLVAQNKSNWDKIRKNIKQMQSEEEQLLQIWVKQSQFNIHNRMLIEFLDTFLTFTILFGVYALLYQQTVKRQQLETIQRTLAQDKELSELKLRFFSMVSHEFRTPLSIILGSAQLLADSSQQWLDSKKLKNLYRIQSSAKLINNLLTDILTLTRAEAGKLECHPELMDIESFCLNLVEDIQFGSGRQHPIKFVSLGRCTHALLDEKLLYSILSNLLSNAIKYSSGKGEIHFVVSCEPEAINVQIKDKGIGIPLEDQQALYEPFHRGQNVGDVVGTGLGLAVVKKCLELHGGRISVESEEGIGTTFIVKIPQDNKVRS